MVKIYLNSKGFLEIEENGITKTVPSGNYIGRCGDNKFGILGVFPITSLSEIKREDGSDYVSIDDISVGLDLVSPMVSTNLALANTWYPVLGSFELKPTSLYFSLVDGVFSYLGNDGVYFLFNGTSDVEVSKNAVLQYGIFINDETEPRGVSVHTFSTPNSYELMAITRYLELNKNDVISIKAKSDVVDTSVSPISLDTTFLGFN